MTITSTNRKGKNASEITGRLFCISTAALMTNVPLTSWSNEMIFREDRKIIN
jgi:hypothetical protein